MSRRAGHHAAGDVILDPESVSGRLYHVVRTFEENGRAMLEVKWIWPLDMSDMHAFLACEVSWFMKGSQLVGHVVESPEFEL